MLRSESENIFVWHIELCLLDIHSAIGMIVFVESQQPVFAVMFDMGDKAGEPAGHLTVTIPDVGYAATAEIDFELQPLKRMCPGVHLRIDESVAVSGADSGDVCDDLSTGRDRYFQTRA